MMCSVSNLTGSTPQARDGEIGSVSEAYFDDENWTFATSSWTPANGCPGATC